MQMRETCADTVNSNLQSFLCELYTQRKHVLCLISPLILTKICLLYTLVKCKQLLSNKIDCSRFFFLES